MRRTKVAVLVAAAILAIVGGFERSGAGAEAMRYPAADVGAAGAMPLDGEPEGGMNLRWCLRGIRWWAEGYAGGNDVLELAGAVTVWLACR